VLHFWRLIKVSKNLQISYIQFYFESVINNESFEYNFTVVAMIYLKDMAKNAKNYEKIDYSCQEQHEN
jgi:hypothetical protein